jgi:hypothetical protein
MGYKYRNSLLRRLKEAKKRYKNTLFNYERSSIKDPNWEEIRMAKNLAGIDLQTIQSRLRNLDRPSSMEEYNTQSSDNNKNNKS